VFYNFGYPTTSLEIKYDKRFDAGCIIKNISYIEREDKRVWIG